MKTPPDARVPVRLVTSAIVTTDGLVIADEAVRLAAPAGARLVAFQAPSHGAGCACCAGRAPLASLLARLFAERARGDIPFFRIVVAVSDASGLRAAREMMRADPFLAGRYREEASGT